MDYFPGVKPDSASRRAFLKRSAMLSVATSATPFAMSLAAMGEAAAASATDYKALVCVFLYGGNDYANTLVPYDLPGYNAQMSFRSNLAIDRAALTPNLLNPKVALAGGRQYALAPGLDPLLPIFNAGNMSVLLNIGTLVEPITKAQYVAGKVPLPPKLFSHNDQQSYWQSESPEGATSGWGGRLGDLFEAGNSNTTFTCIGLSGNAVYLSGQNAVQYQITPTGAVPVRAIQSPLYGSSACSQLLQTLMTAPRNQVLANEYAKVCKRSIDAENAVAAALASSSLGTAFPAKNSLGDQLKMVARLIGARNTLGVKRQVFFVSIGGFDNHDFLLRDHPVLMKTVGDALGAFYQATHDLGVANQVTAFTASDFGRTMVSNSDGSDHGWGSMHFVVGGAVNGGSYVGSPPVIANNGPDDVGQGRMLPALGVDQLASTLATWFGVSNTDQASLLPNLANYSQKNLGFMLPA
jgi:uncharacterized protein (DUF1501 family)